MESKNCFSISHFFHFLLMHQFIERKEEINKIKSIPFRFTVLASEHTDFDI